jgi:hypothetical protein
MTDIVLLGTLTTIVCRFLDEQLSKRFNSLHNWDTSKTNEELMEFFRENLLHDDFLFQAVNNWKDVGGADILRDHSVDELLPDIRVLMAAWKYVKVCHNRAFGEFFDPEDASPEGIARFYAYWYAMEDWSYESLFYDLVDTKRARDQANSAEEPEK